MRLYKTTGGVAAVWSGALADASKDRVAMKKDGFKDVTTEEVDVPTDKKGLLKFLNDEAAS